MVVDGRPIAGAAVVPGNAVVVAVVAVAAAAGGASSSRCCLELVGFPSMSSLSSSRDRFLDATSSWSSVGSTMAVDSPSGGCCGCCWLLLLVVVVVFVMECCNCAVARFGCVRT